jgi:hypothetical protein
MLATGILKEKMGSLKRAKKGKNTAFERMDMEDKVDFGRIENCRRIPRWRLEPAQRISTSR